MDWRPLRVSTAASAQLPPFLLSAVLDSDAYTIHLTDLTHIWSESLDRGGIVRRSRDENTSIDPSDGNNLKILLEKINVGLDGGKNTTSALTITADGDQPTIILHLSVPLPGDLAPLQWPIRLSAAPQALFTSQLTLPLLEAQHTQKEEIRRLGELIESKDIVIQKLLDKLESQGTELGDIFPQAAGKLGRKTDRKRAEDRVRGLVRFDKNTWRRQGLEGERPHNVSQLISELFAEDSDTRLKTDADVTQEDAGESWWESIRGMTVNLNTGRITTNGIGKAKVVTNGYPARPIAGTEVTVDEGDEFQTQETPPQHASRATNLTPSKVVLDDSTASEEDDDDLGGPSQVSKVPDSFPKPQSQHRPPSPSPSPRAASPPKAKKLGMVGLKKAASKPSPSPIEESGDTTEGSPSRSPTAKSPSPSPPPRPKPVKSKLGKVGGKKAASAELDLYSTSEPDPLPATASRSKAKIGKLGGKKTGYQPPDPSSPEPNIKSSLRSTQEGVSSSATVEEEDNDRGRKLKEEKEKTPEPRETSLERADRRRVELKRELEKAKQPVKKKRRF